MANALDLALTPLELQLLAEHLRTGIIANMRPNPANALSQDPTGDFLEGARQGLANGTLLPTLRQQALASTAIEQPLEQRRNPISAYLAGRQQRRQRLQELKRLSLQTRHLGNLALNALQPGDKVTLSLLRSHTDPSATCTVKGTVLANVLGNDPTPALYVKRYRTGGAARFSSAALSPGSVLTLIGTHPAGNPEDKRRGEFAQGKVPLFGVGGREAKVSVYEREYPALVLDMLVINGIDMFSKATWRRVGNGNGGTYSYRQYLTNN